MKVSTFIGLVLGEKSAYDVANTTGNMYKWALLAYNY